MKKQVWRLLSAGLGAAAMLAALCMPAQAVVGPSNEDASFAAHVVTVLKRGVDEAGFCTGIVLSPRAILTAAHCLATPANIRVFYRDGAGQPVFVEVEAIAAHPNFHADAAAKRIVSVDLAVIRTKTPLAPAFSAAKLSANGSLAVGEPVRIVGYGVSQEGKGKTAGVLRSAALRVRAPLSAILLWAEDPSDAGAGGCTGDSGGPILSDPGDEVVAVTAWSAGKGRLRCGALTQGLLVVPYMDWIQDVLKRWGPD